MRHSLLLGVAAVALSGWQAPCWAQPTNDPTAMGTVTGRLADASVANGANDRSLKTSDAPDIQLLASADDKTVSMSWSYKFDRGSKGFTQINLAATAALNDNGHGTELLGLRGLAGGTEVKIGFTHFSAKYVPIDSATSAREMQANALVAPDGGSCAARWEVLGERDAEALCAQGSAARDALIGENRPSDVNLAPTSARALMMDRLANVVRNFRPPSSIKFIGADFTGNQADFKYLDQVAFQTRKTSKFAYSGSVFAGLIWPKSRTSVTVAVNYGRTYDAQNSITLCQPINAIPQTRCITAAGGPPDRSDSAIGTLDVRQGFHLGKGTGINFALAPSASVDLRSGDYSVDLPIYFAQDSKDKLRGGIRLSYLNEKQANGSRKGDFTVGLFVGVPFTLVRD